MLQRDSTEGKKNMVKESSGRGLGKRESGKEYLETEVPEGAALPRSPAPPRGTDTHPYHHRSSITPSHGPLQSGHILLTLTGRLQQKLMPMVSNFYFGWPEINSAKLTLCWLLYSIVAPDTPVASSNFHEMLSSIHLSLEAKKHPLAP